MIYIHPTLFPVVAFVFDEDYMIDLLEVGQGVIM